MRAVVMAATMCVSVVAISTADEAQSAIRRNTHIEAQKLGPALRLLAKDRGFQVLFRSDLVRDLDTSGAAGEMTTEEALRQILRGTELSFRYLDENTVTIVPAASSSCASAYCAHGESLEIDEGERAALQATYGNAPSTTRDHSDAPPHRFLLAEAAGGEISAKNVSDNGETGEESMRLEEIVVTARRREEKIQSVPVAITAFSQENLRENNINSIQDLQNFVPSLSINGLSRIGANVFIRGQGLPPGGVGGPGVVSYFNEVPLPADTFGQLIAGPGLYSDLESVQVLKGPQGTLFGRNTVGGAILFQPKRPTNEFGGHVELTGGNYDNRQLDAVLNVPLVQDKLLFRVAVNGQKREGYTRMLGDANHPNGQDLDNIDYFAARATVTFKPTDALQNDLTFAHVDYRSHGTAEILSYFNPNGFVATCTLPDSSPCYPGFAALFAQQQALGTRKILPLSGVPDFTTTKDVFTAITDILRYDLTDTLAIRNIFGSVRLDRAQGEDRDGTAFRFFDLKIGPVRTHQYTEELQLQGNSWGGKLTWVMGAFFLHAPMQEFGEGLNINNNVGCCSRAGSKSKAGYTQATYDLSSWIEGLKVTGGVRYTWDDKFNQNRLRSPSDSSCPYPNANPPDCLFSDSQGSEAFTWNLSLDYQVTPETLLYVTSRDGYRPGGENAFLPDGTRIAPPYGPEYVTDVELGVKSDWQLAGMPVRTNVDIYNQNYTDIQAAKSFAITPDPAEIIGFTENAGKARVRGVEFEGAIHPTPRLHLGAIYSLLDFKYLKFLPGVDVSALIGQQHIGRPRNKYGLNARYELPVSPSAGEVSLSANWSWQSWSGVTVAINGGPGNETPAYGLLTLGADWNHIGGGPLDASFFMTNALDKTYIAAPLGYYPFTGYSLAIYGEPRMYGLRLRWKFGQSK